MREFEIILDEARGSQKMKSILTMVPLHHRDEVKDLLASVCSYFYVKFCLHLLLILLHLALSFYTHHLERADVTWDLLKGVSSINNGMSGAATLLLENIFTLEYYKKCTSGEFH